ncbi:hypothetical protein SSPO_096410 [Streptomyces antimycoticus]|uniref:Transketolase N-terminal domain-containing protein n=1 Tax=Streptomyces antimycoticus TaxID=68175 RepID=A0A499UXW8_9ACTN|nr:hypothetical protein SSPO_096410 [Streptomyces antimycoticus]
MPGCYQARFNRYLRARGIKDTSASRVWAFLGDGEMDEPESMAALTLASREGLDNLTFVINCNLQRLDGPVGSNSKIVQELEARFRGAGWNVVKTLWGEAWDPLLGQDTTGRLVRRLGEVHDAQMQTLAARDAAYIRKNFFTGDALVRPLLLPERRAGGRAVRELPGRTRAVEGVRRLRWRRPER